MTWKKALLQITLEFKLSKIETVPIIKINKIIFNLSKIQIILKLIFKNRIRTFKSTTKIQKRK